MGRGELKKLIFIIMLTIIVTAFSNFFVLKDLYTLGIIIVSTVLLMLIFDYKKNTIDKNIIRFKTNLFLVSIFLSLTQIFETISGLNDKLTIENVAVGFKPMVIGIYVYMIFVNLVPSNKSEDDTKITVDKLVISEDSEENKKISRKEDVKSKIKALNLTRRESEIFELLLEDLPNKEIADKLFIAEATVKKHVQNILKKAYCGNRLELIEKYKI